MPVAAPALTWEISPADVLLGALERAWSESHPIVMIYEAGAGARTDDTCSI